MGAKFQSIFEGLESVFRFFPGAAPMSDKVMSPSSFFLLHGELGATAVQEFGVLHEELVEENVEGDTLNVLSSLVEEPIDKVDINQERDEGLVGEHYF